MTGARLIYGFDPLCGWCFGFVPAMRAFTDGHPDVPVELVLGGLVTGERVGPYREMVPYIRQASERLQAVTGRRPSNAFFDRIGASGTIGSSVEPSIVIQDVLDHEPERGLAFAHDVIKAHFEDGADLNDRALYARLFADHGIDRPIPAFDEAHRERIARRFEGARMLGIDSFPTLIAVRGEGAAGRGEGAAGRGEGAAGRGEGRGRLPSVYEPDAFVAEAERALGLQAAAA